MSTLASTPASAGALLERMTPAARRRFGSDRAWAAACGLPAETLSRLRKRESCDLRTLAALAAAAGFTLEPVPAGAAGAGFGRAREEELLELAASGDAEAATWRRFGEPFFMGGLAMLLACARGFDRRRYLELAEALHPGMSRPEVFAVWLERTPVSPSRFLPLARHRSRLAP